MVVLSSTQSNLHLDYSVDTIWINPRPSSEMAPAKILLAFLCTAPLQYVPKILFTQAIIDCLTTNETKNALHKETAILNYIGGDPISYSLSN